jgi:hypothetical protein
MVGRGIFIEHSAILNQVLRPWLSLSSENSNGASVAPIAALYSPRFFSNGGRFFIGDSCWELPAHNSHKKSSLDINLRPEH